MADPQRRRDRLSGLSPEKRALLKKRLDLAKGSKQETSEIPHRNMAQSVPLTYAQQRLWFLDQFEDASTGYNEHFFLRIQGDLNHKALQQSADALVRRHEILRTTFEIEEDQPVQRVHSFVDTRVQLLEPASEDSLEARLRGITGKPFNLTEGPLLRFVLIRTGNLSHVFGIVIHHIITDGWSTHILFKELSHFYTAFSNSLDVSLEPLSIQYGDFACWQQSDTNVAGLKQDLDYWEKRLRGAPTSTELPTDHPRPPQKSFRGKTKHFTIGSDSLKSLRTISRKNNGTLYSTLLAIFNVLISRYTGNTDIVVGTPVANRQRRETEPLIGFFVNTLPIRSNLSGNPEFFELLQRVGREAMEDLSRQGTPLEKIVSSLGIRPQPDRHPLFQVIFSLREFQPVKFEFDGLEMEPLRLDSEAAKFDLSFDLEVTGAQISGLLEYNITLFHSSTIDRLINHFLNLLEHALRHPNSKISELAMCGEDETRTLLHTWNQTTEPFPEDISAHEFFRRQAAQFPERCALALGDQQLSYHDLDERSNQLAQLLITSGVKPESRIGLCLPRSPDAFVSILGILKAGAAYVPLDPKYPTERLNYMIKDSGCTLVLGAGAPPSELELARSEYWNLPEKMKTTEGQVSSAPAVDVFPSNLAYIIYTSGSTGRPKGVAIPHRGILNLEQAQRKLFDIREGDRVLQFASLNFDASVSEMWTTWGAGGTLILANEDQRSDPEKLARLLKEERIQIASLPPSLWSLLPPELPDLRSAVSCGERCGNELAEKWNSPNGRFINAYGPSEATVCATGGRQPDPANSFGPPIGRPIDNTQVYILAPSGSPSPIGVFGELFLSGAGLARSYWQRPALTAERFLPNPFDPNPGSRLYRTGDVARYLPNGDIEFAGRTDDQLKVRGFRVEPGEIEAAITSFPEISHCVVTSIGSGSDQQLVAYFAANQKLETGAIRSWLSERLPGYMIPGFWVQIERIPLNRSGKVDRANLPDPRASITPQAGVPEAPLTETERHLHRIWVRVLGQNEIGANDDFFDLGGHSLSAAQIVTRIRREFQVKIELRDFFQFRTLSRMAGFLDSRENVGSIVPAKRPVFEDAPLSFAQERLYFLQRLAPQDSSYNVCGAIRLRGKFDPQIFQNVFAELIVRHESLRTTFQEIDGVPRQKIAQPTPFHLKFEDLSDLSPEMKEARSSQLIRESVLTPFDLANGPMLRTGLIRLNEDEYVLLLGVHHLVTDAWSVSILLDEISVLYHAFKEGRLSPLEPLHLQFADYASWQRTYLSEARLEPQIIYWKAKLENLPPLDLLTDFRRPSRLTHRGHHQTFIIEHDFLKKVKEAAQHHDTTLFAFTFSCFGILIHRLSGQNDFAIGFPSANRDLPETEGLFGFLINTLVLRFDFSDNPTFGEVLDQVRRDVLDAQANQDVPFERLVEELGAERDPSRPPLFQVMFAFQNAPKSINFSTLLSAEPIHFENGLSKFELTFELQEIDGKLKGMIEYNRDLFEASSIERFHTHFTSLLESVLEDPGQRVSAYRILSQKQTEETSDNWSRRPSEYPRTESVATLFDLQAKSAPDAIALMDQDGSWSYRTLNDTANRIARCFLEKGCTPETRIGISLERTKHLVAVILGTLKAGGVYVPLDPDYPDERLQFMLEDSHCSFVICDASSASKFSSGPIESIELESLIQKLDSHETDTKPVEVDPNQIAYISYTSGSTGKPKGVEITQRGIIRLVRNNSFVDNFPGDCYLLHSPIAFDASVLEIWGSLLNGLRLGILPPGKIRLEALSKAIKAYEVSTLWLTSSLFHAMVDEQIEALKPVRQVLSGGDVLSVVHVERFLQEAPASQLINGYGPTENTTFTTCHRIHKEDLKHPSIPIGKVIANSEIFVLDAALNPVPPGAPGELYIGGDGLARGYANRPRLTAENFIPHPFSQKPGARLYRSGDTVRFLPGGVLEFLGRRDHLVKIRGFRIELGEIETQLQRQPRIQSAVVITRSNKAEEKQLIAYIIGEGPIDHKRLKESLSEKLPLYMIPSIFVELESFPRTPSGKIDRRRLPDPNWEQLESDASSIVTRKSAIEEDLQSIWRELLGLPAIGTRDNFFHFGGHSLLATRLMSRIRNQLNCELELNILFEKPTIEELAVEIAARKRNQYTPIVSISREGSSSIPLSSAQERLWFLQQMDTGNTGYNVPVALKITGRFSSDVLQKVFDALIERHESLRTCFPVTSGKPWQQIHPSLNCPLRLTSLIGHANQAAELESIAIREANTPFDLATGPLIRLHLLKLGESHHVLLITLHHVITDGWSMGILVREMTALFHAFSEGKPNPLKPLKLNYVDFANWHRTRLDEGHLEEQRSYWIRQLRNLPSLELNTDRPRPKKQTYNGAHIDLEIEADSATKLNALSQRHRVTLFMTLLAVFKIALARYSNQKDIAVGTPIANRTHPDTEDIFGFFVNTLVLRSRYGREASFIQLLEEIRETTLEAYRHQDFPFEQVVDALSLPRDPSRSPLFQVMFVLQNADLPKLKLPGLEVEPMDFETGIAKFDLSVTLAEEDGRIKGTVEYNTDLFDEESIHCLIRSYQTLIQAATAQPDTSIGELALISEKDRKALKKWNQREKDFPSNLCLNQFFESQAASFPDSIAVICENDQRTYEEINRAANQLAHHLIEHSAGPETRIGVCLDRGIEMIIAILAVLKTGAAYVPMDPSYPAERLGYMLENCRSNILITRKSRQLTHAVSETRMIDPGETSMLQGYSDQNPTPSVLPDNAAYLIYTSGSTGRPKGVVVSHRGVLNLQQSQREIFGIAREDRLLLFSSFSFDASVSDMWMAFGAGAALVIASDNERRSPAALGERIQSGNVTAAALTPTVWSVLDPETPGLRTVVMVGEVCTREAVRRWEKPGRRVLNAYGPTECTVCATATELEEFEHETPPIGLPIANTRAHVISPGGETAPIGASGELYLSSVGLARGYWNQPALTAEKFLPDPYSKIPGSRMYRTGDWVRRRSDGLLDFQGRIDDQVKFHGHRIELGEIESVISQHPGVEQCAAVLKHDPQGNPQLAAYVVSSEPIEKSEIRNLMNERLPRSMIPDAIEFIEKLPISPSGKVDRAALPDIQADRSTSAAPFQAPRNPLEVSLADDWKRVLSLNEIGVYDNFFEVGGNSMKTVQLLELLERSYPKVFTISDLFDQHTIAMQASYIGKKRQSTESSGRAEGARKKPQRIAF